MIRTDPKERGFEYRYGVKRQAGQDRKVVEASLGAEGTAVATETVTNLGRSLDNLEAAAVAGKTHNGEKLPLADLEELEALRKLNERASSEGKDVDYNASIRKSFRTDRRENRRRLVGAGSLGWRKGMSLLPSSESDVLTSKETCYGRASINERSKLSRVRKSSIFDSRSHRLKQAKRKGNRKCKQEKSSRRNAPEVVASSDPDLDPSGRPLDDLPSPTPTPENISSSSSCSLPTAIPKTTLKLFNNNGVVSIASRGGEESSPASSTTEAKVNRNETISASGTTKTGCSSSKGPGNAKGIQPENPCPTLLPGTGGRVRVIGRRRRKPLLASGERESQPAGNGKLCGRIQAGLEKRIHPC